MRDRILEPFELHNTSYPAEDDLSLPDPFIRGYERAGTSWRECSNVFFGRGDGALISTALDVSRFFRGLLVGRLLPDSLLDQMRSIVHDDPPAEDAYGLGLMADHLPSGTVWGHAGGGFGYGHLPYLHPETGRLVICMLNGTYGFRTSSTTPAARRTFSPSMRAAAYDAKISRTGC